MNSLSGRSPLLPWEVIETIIGYSCYHPETLYNFSLTCHDLRPLSLCFLVIEAALRSRNQLFDFCDFLQAKPHLKPLVRTILVNPNDFAPVPLLRILPNLSEIKFTTFPASPIYPFIPTVLNQSSLTYCHLNTRIQTLHLSNLSFTTYRQFLRALSAFSNIVHLVCSDVRIEAEGDRAHLGAALRRLSSRLRLLTLTISHGRGSFREYYYNEPSVGALLLDSGLVQSTVESLTVEDVYRSTRPPRQFKWPRLRSLTLKLRSSAHRDIRDGIEFLEDFRNLNLKELTVEVHRRTIIPTVENLELFGSLELALTRFPHACLVWILDVFPLSKGCCWAKNVEERFPTLFRHGALSVVPNPDLRTGHTGGMSALVVSPDSKWVASGSLDGTIALWETASGAMVRRWIPYDGGNITSLAFSPSSQYLVSSAQRNSGIVIWNLAGDLAHRVLEGHTDTVAACAWSPRGATIASGSHDGNVCLWDITTFQPPVALEHPAPGNKIALVEFSPNGRWLIVGCYPSSYFVWDVALATEPILHMSLVEEEESSHDIPIVAAFNPSSTGFAIASPTCVVKILILETKSQGGGLSHVVLVGRGARERGWETSQVAFSPDGNLVLTVPSEDCPTHAVRIWDAYTGAHLLSLERHVLTACFSPCGRYIVSVSWDRRVRLWMTSYGSCIATLELSEHNFSVPLSHVFFSPDGKVLVSGGDDGKVIIRQMDILAKNQRDS